MEEQKLKELIKKAINKGWVFYGEFSTDVATESVLKLLKEQLHIPIVVGSAQVDCLDYSQGYDRCEKQCKRCEDL